MTPFTSDRRIRFAELSKKSRMAVSNFSKKADQRHQTFSKKFVEVAELSLKSLPCDPAIRKKSG
jgi:hypothetical protein